MEAFAASKFFIKPGINQNFDHCIKAIMIHEGGLTDDRYDPGGITKYGVSLRFIRSIGFDVDNDGDVDADDVIQLNIPDSQNIYRKYWWDKYDYNRLNNIKVVEKVFDLAVNMGGVSAHKILQRACNQLLEHKLIVDGKLGKKTIEAANTLNPSQLRQNMRILAKERYLRIIANNPSLKGFERGWMSRASW